MELHDDLPALSSCHPDLPDNSDDRLRALNYSSDQSGSYIDNDILSNSTRLLGATKGPKDSNTSSESTTNFLEEISRSDEIVTDASSLDIPDFSTQDGFLPEQVAHCSSLSSPLSTSSNERSQSSASRPNPRSETTWPDKVEEAFQKGLLQMRDHDYNY